MEDIIQTVSTYRDFFLGKPMQWIKHQDKNKWATVVTVADVFNRGKVVFAKMSDGTVLPVTAVSSDLMMITPESPAMSRAAVLSINADPGVQADATAVVDDPAIKKEVKENIQATRSLDRPINSGQPGETHQPHHIDQPLNQHQPPVQTKPTTNFFAQFESEKTKLNLSLNLSIPPMNLLRMMYTNAKDKTVFMKDLCQHINNQITPEVIQESISKKIDNKKEEKE